VHVQNNLLTTFSIRETARVRNLLKRLRVIDCAKSFWGGALPAHFSLYVMRSGGGDQAAALAVHVSSPPRK
jgi:hypothetical protein